MAYETQMESYGKKYERKEIHKEPQVSKFKECFKRMEKQGIKKFNTKEFSISLSKFGNLSASISIKDKTGERKLSLHHYELVSSKWKMGKDKFIVEQKNKETKKLEKVEPTDKVVGWLLKKIDLYTKEIEVLKASKEELKDLAINIADNVWDVWENLIS